MWIDRESTAKRRTEVSNWNDGKWNLKETDDRNEFFFLIN